MKEYTHQISDILQLDLNDYISLTESYVKTKADQKNSPFFLEGNNHELIIFTHGFSSSPYAFRSLAYRLNKEGFSCFAPLLLGHGTNSSDLNQIKQDDWFKAINHFINCSYKKYQKIHLIGHSYGALLSILQTHKTPEMISSLVLFAPAFELNPPKTAYLPSLIYPLSKIIPLRLFSQVGSLCGSDLYSYPYFPMKAAKEVSQAILKAKAIKSKKITQPIFMILSTEDETTSYKSALRFFYHQENSKNHCQIYSALDNFKIDHPKINVLDSRKYSPQIIDFSHLGMHIDINDPHYGINGHYYNNQAKEPLIFGAMTTKNKRRIKHLRRIAFNPDFDQLVEKILLFLE